MDDRLQSLFSPVWHFGTWLSLYMISFSSFSLLFSKTIVLSEQYALKTSLFLP